MSADKIIADREPKYGSFSDQAFVAEALHQILLSRLNDAKRFHYLPMETQAQISQAIKLICVKLARAVCGDPTLLDNPTDIGGYALLWERAILDMKGKYGQSIFGVEAVNAEDLINQANNHEKMMQQLRPAEAQGILRRGA